MSELYLKWMDRLYLLAMVAAGLATGDDDCDPHWHLLAMCSIAANRPEPIAIICMVTFTFIGAAVSYRAGSHIAVNMLTDRLPASLQRVCARVVDLLMLLISGLMCWYSYWLCVELWEQPVAEFPP